LPARRESRFVIEVLFLVALAVSVTIAELRPFVIAGAMALGWVLVAGVEWAAWRDQPHYGSGLPPRWYVPRVDLPPARPLESVVSGYPAGPRDEAPTWIAPAELREQVLGGDWPLAVPIEEPESEPEELVVEEAWTIVELPPAPAPVAEEPAAAATASEPEPAPEPEPVGSAPPLAATPRSVEAVARYSLDPLAEESRRRFGRGESTTSPTIVVPARPDRGRALPGVAERDE
jgi:hypothetical protein